MSIIIRLQNLPTSASSLDIRRFFSGLLIPDGGVHIIGGPNKIAFIAFSNDEDARQAMARQDEGLIKDTKIQLFLSSRSEMKQVIDKARNQNLDKIKSASATSSTASNQQAQLGNGVQLIRNTSNSLNNNLTNLSTNKTETNKLNQTATVQINYSNGSNVTSLQETPDYRRNRSPVDRQTMINDRSVTNPNDNLFNNQRLNHISDNARNIENIDNGPNLQGNNSNNNLNLNLNNGISVKSRLGGFDLPLVNEIELNTWNSNALMNGTNSNSPVPALLLTPQTQHPNLNHRNNRFLNVANSRSFYDANSMNNMNNMNNTILINQPAPFQLPNRFIIELKGLPINVQTVDIQSFFRPVGIHINRDQIKLSLDEHGIFHGTAHLLFYSEQDLENALLLNGRLIGDHTIEVMPIIENNGGALLSTPFAAGNQSDLNLIANQQQFNYFQCFDSNHNLNADTVGYSRRETLYPIFMKGIPYSSCTKEDVENFFQPIPLFKVIIIQERNGRATGNAYVILDSRDHFESAMKRHSKYMGSRYIELFAIQMDEVERYMDRLNYRQQLGSNSLSDFEQEQHFNRKRKRGNSAGRSFNNSEKIYCVHVKSIPPYANNDNLTNYFMKFGSIAHAVHIMLKANRENAGECFVEFKDFASFEKALKQNGEKMDDYRISVQEIAYSKVCHIVRSKPQSSKISRATGRDRESNLDKSSTVSARVSLRATESDICAFFSDFNLRPNQINWKLDHNHVKGDEVLIRFKNPKEANRAIRTMNRKFFIDNRIQMKTL